MPTGLSPATPLPQPCAQQAANHALISYRHYENIGKTFFGHEPADSYKVLIQPV